MKSNKELLEAAMDMNDFKKQRTPGEWKHFIQPTTTGLCDTINVDTYRIATMENKKNSAADAAFICKAVNNHDSLLEHLSAVTYEYEVALKLLSATGSVGALHPDINNLIINAKAAIKKAQQ